MSPWLSLLAAGGNTLVVLRALRRGILVYVVLALTLPHASMGGTSIAYEILAFPPVFFMALFRRRRLSHSGFHLGLAVYLALILLASILAMTLEGSTLDLIRLQGTVRALLLLALFHEVLERRGIERALIVVLCVNVVIGFVQLLQPETADTFFALYGRPGQSVLERYAEAGLIPRAPGTLGSPVNLGVFSLLSFSIAWGAFVVGGRERRHAWLLALATIAGLLSVTKTFLVGAPIVFLSGVGMWFVSGRHRSRRMQAALLSGISGLTAGVGYFLMEQGVDVLRYLSYLTNPIATLESRYGPHGLLADAWTVIENNIVFGVGMTRVKGEFLGDSMYVTLLHATGVVGTTLAAVGLVFILRSILTRNRYSDFLIVGAFLISGLALSLLFSLTGALTITYLLTRSRGAVRSPAPSTPLA